MFRSRSSAAIAVALVACGGTQKTSPAPRCPSVVTVASQEELAALSTCTSFDALTIRTGVALDLAPLAKLEQVRERFIIGPTLAIDHISFPALREVGDLTIQSNAALGGVFLPQLTLARNVTIAGNGTVTTVSLPRLIRIASNLRIEENGSLEIIDLASLSTVESLGIVNNPVLATLELSTALDTKTRVIEGNRALGELQPPVPTDGGGDHE